MLGILDRSPSPSILYQIPDTPPRPSSPKIQPDHILHQGIFNIPDSPNPSSSPNALGLPIPPRNIFTIPDTPNHSPTIPANLFQLPDSPNFRANAMDVDIPSHDIISISSDGSNPSPSAIPVELPAIISPRDLLFQVPDLPNICSDATNVCVASSSTLPPPPSTPNHGADSNSRSERPRVSATRDAIIPYLPGILSHTALLRAYLAEISQDKIFVQHRIDTILADIAELDRTVAGLRALQIWRGRHV
jgi:hypothetical protein